MAVGTQPVGQRVLPSVNKGHLSLYGVSCDHWVSNNGSTLSFKLPDLNGWFFGRTFCVFKYSLMSFNHAWNAGGASSIVVFLSVYPSMGLKSAFFESITIPDWFAATTIDSCSLTISMSLKEVPFCCFIFFWFEKKLWAIAFNSATFRVLEDAQTFKPMQIIIINNAFLEITDKEFI